MTLKSSGALAPTPFQFHSLVVRTVVDDHGNPWFCAKDVCAVLGYANDSKAIGDHCRKEGITKRYPLETDGGVQYPAFIHEGNLYRLIIKSRKPEAEPFEQWVMDEVLPTIRKTGGYTKPPYALRDLRSKKALPGGLTLEQQDAIKALVRSRVEALPKERQGGAAITCWSALKTKFGCTYKAITPDLFAEALSLIARLDLLVPPALPAPETFEPPRYTYPLSDWNPETRIGDTGWFTLREWDRLREPGSPLSRHLRELERDGNDVSLLRLEHSGLCHLVETLRGQLQAIRVIADRMDGNGLYVALRQAA